VTIMIVASIVAGEVGSSVPDARMLVACQVKRDAEAGRRIGPPRWNGWRTPSALDVAAAKRALTTDACSHLPSCRFLGNESDLVIWRRLGYVKSNDAILRTSNGRWTAVCVLETTWQEAFAQRGHVPR